MYLFWSLIFFKLTMRQMYSPTTTFDASQIIPLGIASVLFISKWFLNISWISFIQVKSLSKRLFGGQRSQNPKLTQPPTFCSHTPSLTGQFNLQASAEPLFLCEIFLLPPDRGSLPWVPVESLLPFTNFMNACSTCCEFFFNQLPPAGLNSSEAGLPHHLWPAKQ